MAKQTFQYHIWLPNALDHVFFVVLCFTITFTFYLVSVTLSVLLSYLIIIIYKIVPSLKCLINCYFGLSIISLVLPSPVN